MDVLIIRPLQYHYGTNKIKTTYTMPNFMKI